MQNSVLRNVFFDAAGPSGQVSHPYNCTFSESLHPDSTQWRFKIHIGWVPVAHAYNPSSSGGPESIFWANLLY
jgi:hypothetical protein